MYCNRDSCFNYAYQSESNIFKVLSSRMDVVMTDLKQNANSSQYEEHLCVYCIFFYMIWIKVQNFKVCIYIYKTTTWVYTTICFLYYSVNLHGFLETNDKLYCICNYICRNV